MPDKKLKIATGLLSVGLLTTLIIKLTTVPDGIILSGLFMGLMVVGGLLIISLLFVAVLKIFIKKYSFLTLYFMTTSVCFIVYHYNLYSPTIKITVPKGYSGAVTLVLSNVDKNILTVDSHGIGYLTKWTFNKTYTEPVVVETDGTQINDRCVGFNPSTFWGFSRSSFSRNKLEIRSLTFEILPKDTNSGQPYYRKDFSEFIDTNKVDK